MLTEAVLSCWYLTTVETHNDTNDQPVLRFAKKYLNHYLLMKQFSKVCTNLTQAEAPW